MENIYKKIKGGFSLRFLVTKVREKGLVWCVHTLWLRIRRCVYAVCSGLNLCTRPIRANLWSVPDNIRYNQKKQSDVLYAFYDLEVAPATFDIVFFIVLAELKRKEIGCKSLHIVIVPGPNEGFRENDLKGYRRLGGVDYDIESMRWRLKNILVPCCWLIPSCRQLTVCTSRQEAQAFQASLVRHIFPTGYTVRFPIEKHLLGHFVAASSQGAVLLTIQATPQARRFISDWIQQNAGERKVIAISLRECSYQTHRNSNLKAWGAFARGLNSSIYCPVIVRDTEAAFASLPSELDGLIVFPEVPWNIELRVALYELSYLNMFVSNGPGALCVCNRRTPYLVFKVISPTGTDEAWFRSQGVEPGSQLKFMTAFQRWVWEDDRLEVIQKAFSQICERMERFSMQDR